MPNNQLESDARKARAPHLERSTMSRGAYMHLILLQQLLKTCLRERPQD